jgi:hypothetical protein
VAPPSTHHNINNLGHVAEWLRNGLQNRVPRFNSGRGLQNLPRSATDLTCPVWQLPVREDATRSVPDQGVPDTRPIRRFGAHVNLDNSLNAAMHHVYCCFAASPSDFFGIPDYLGDKIDTPNRGIPMTTLVLPGRVRETSRLRRFFGAVNEFVAGIRLARAMAARYSTLSRLSDVELARQGIAREDIPRVVVNGKYDV